jgi:hypothetical protein
VNIRLSTSWVLIYLAKVAVALAGCVSSLDLVLGGAKEDKAGIGFKVVILARMKQSAKLEGGHFRRPVRRGAGKPNPLLPRAKR